MSDAGRPSEVFVPWAATYFLTNLLSLLKPEQEIFGTSEDRRPPPLKRDLDDYVVAFFYAKAPEKWRNAPHAVLDDEGANRSAILGR